MKDELDDWIPELPPLDDGDDEPPLADEGDADSAELDPGSADEGDPFDDGTADHLAVGEDEIDDAGEEEGSAADDAAGPSAELAYEELDLDEESALSGAADDMPGIADDEIEVDEIEGTYADDRGEDGTGEPIEESLEGDLPPLDADDESDHEEALFDLDPPHLGELGGPELPPWSDLAWENVQVPAELVTEPIHALAVSGDTVVVATGAGLRAFEIDLVKPRALSAAGLAGARLAKLAVSGLRAQFLAAVAESGSLFVSRDGGKTFDEPRGFRGPSGARGRDAASTANTAAGDVLWGEDPSVECPPLWLRTRGGALFRSADGGASWEALGDTGVVLAMGRRERQIVAVVRTERGFERRTYRPASGTLEVFSESLSIEADQETEAPAPAQHATISLADDAMAFAASGSRIWLAAGGSAEPAAYVPYTAGARDLTFAGTDAAAPLLVLLGHGDEARMHLASVDRATRAARVVGEVAHEQAVEAAAGEGAGNGSGKSGVLAWSGSRELLWVGASFGLFAFRSRKVTRPS